MVYGVCYSLISVIFGLWGLPWGPILTAKAIWVNLKGGNDASEEVEDWLDKQPIYEAQEASGAA